MKSCDTLNKQNRPCRDFQKATVDHIDNIFCKALDNKNGSVQRRILCADEVGLGKTIIAREVIKRVRNKKKSDGCDRFCMVYVCSNIDIARQNADKLEFDRKIDVTGNRLSMQHFNIWREEKQKDRIDGEMLELRIPLTPKTSFSQHGSKGGDKRERALIAVILSNMKEFSIYEEEIKDVFRTKRVGKQAWRKVVEECENSVCELGSEYILDLKNQLSKREDYRTAKRKMLKSFRSDTEYNKVINDFRQIFARVSLSMLKPDLIIMDEFQRFSELLPIDNKNRNVQDEEDINKKDVDIEDEDDVDIIAKEFLMEGKENEQKPLILLLSATPYKPFSTQEELIKDNIDNHYEDFNHLMRFLFKDKEKRFTELWSDYSKKLFLIKNEKFDVILASKIEIEKEMYKVMCRSERKKENNLILDKVEEIPIDENDIRSFVEMQRVVQKCAEKANKRKIHFEYANMPVDYVKSAPYLLSYMESYELKKQIVTVCRKYSSLKPSKSDEGAECVLLQEEKLRDFREVPMRNARLQYLCDEVMLPKNKKTELLLWVPASKPYYFTDEKNNPFELNRDFSKLLVFSAWEMVPRMISTMMTYEVEHRIISSKYGKRYPDNRKYSEAFTEKRRKQFPEENQLGDVGKEILTCTSPKLSSFYTPDNSFGKSIREIRVDIKKKIEEELKGVYKASRRSNDINAKEIREIIKWLDDKEGAPHPKEVSKTTIDVLVNMAIAAPAICLYRILQNEKEAKKAAECFITMFDRRIAGCIIEILYKYKKRNFIKGVLEYCVNGNLQAVLNEYVYMMNESDPKKIAETIKDSCIKNDYLSVDTNNSFAKSDKKKFKMRISYAVPFTKGKNAEANRNNNVRNAFLSPFYPFVLASTSVGQEGLDFHWYCRKVMHWNLPSNPQDIEQREGRINRYQGLAIRRNLAKLEKDAYDWDEIFDKANKKKDERYSDMIPHWCLQPEWITKLKKDESIEWIERIVPQYPMSIDKERYKRLIDVLSLYRLTMGQSNQEVLLDMLKEQNLSSNQIKDLQFDFSPYDIQKKKILAKPK